MDYALIFVLLVVVIIILGWACGAPASPASAVAGFGSAIGSVMSTHGGSASLHGVSIRQNTHKGKDRGDAVKDLAAHPRSRSEQNAVAILESVTGESFPTVNPAWLVWKGKTLELDGYNAQLHLALEFSGPLHTKWFPQKEPYSAYFDRITKDIVKLRICKREHVNLIVLDMSLPSHHWRNYLLSRLYDARVRRVNGSLIVPDRPDAYIEPQIADPFRNEQIERELGLMGDMTAALRL